MGLEKNNTFPNIIVYITKDYPIKSDAIIQKKYLKELNDNTEEIPIRIDLLSDRLLEEFKADNNILNFDTITYNDIAIGNKQFVYLNKIIENNEDKELIKNYINSKIILNKLKEVKLDSKIEFKGIHEKTLSEINDMLNIGNKKEYISEVIKNNSNLNTVLNSLFDILKIHNNTSYIEENLAYSNDILNSWPKYCIIISTSVSNFKEDTNNLIQILNKKVIDNTLKLLYSVSNLENLLKESDLKILSTANKKEILDNFTNYFTLDSLKSKIEDLNFNNFLYLMLDILEKILIDGSNIKYVNASNKTESDLDVNNLNAVINTEKYVDDIEIKYNKNESSTCKATNYFTIFIILNAISKEINKNTEQNKQFLKVLSKVEFTEELLFLFE